MKGIAAMVCITILIGIGLVMGYNGVILGSGIGLIAGLGGYLIGAEERNRREEREEDILP